MKTRHPITLLSLLALVAGVTGCTHVIKPEQHVFNSYPSADPINLRVGLQFNKEFQEAKWEHKSMGDTFRMPMGPLLEANAETLARKTFTSVVVTRGTTNAPAEVQAVLTPRMLVVEQSMGIWKWSPGVLTMSVEWHLKDPGGRTVWIDSVQGEGKAEMGNAFTGKKRQNERVRLMIDDLFKKSHQALADSPEIRAFATQRAER